mgnify:CR=1 FL=1
MPAKITKPKIRYNAPESRLMIRITRSLNFLPISQVVPTVLVYDELNSQLLVGAGSSLSLRSFPTMQIVWAHSFVAHLEGVAVLYNK